MIRANLGQDLVGSTRAITSTRRRTMVWERKKGTQRPAASSLIDTVCLGLLCFVFVGYVSPSPRFDDLLLSL